MYEGGYADGTYFDQHQQQQQQQQQGHYSQQVQHQYSAHAAYGGFSEQHGHGDHNQGGQMVADMGCYGLHANGEFADISSLEPSIYPQQMMSEEQQQQFAASHQNGYPSATLPIVPGGPQLYRPQLSFNNSPTGSSQASTGSEEGEEFYGSWHPYKRSPPNASLMMASAVGGEMLDCKKRGGKTTKKRKPKKDPNEPQKPVSAYALFFRDTQAAIKGQNPNASFGEVSKIVASMWDGLDAEAKNNYKQKTEVAKKDYLKQLAAYRANQISRSGGNPCSMMEALGHTDYSIPSNNGGKLFAQGAAGSSPDSTTSHASDSKEAIAAADLGGKTLASMIAEPAPQQVLTATTTLTLRNKSDYDDASDASSYPLCVRTNSSSEQNDAHWDHDFRPNEGLVQHCRDVFNIWGPSRPPPSSAAPPGYLPV